MARWTGTRRVNLSRLSSDLGPNVPLRLTGRGDSDDKKVITAEGITDVALGQAIAIHDPAPTWATSPSPDEADALAREKRIKELAAKPSLTTAETAEAIRLLLRSFR